MLVVIVLCLFLGLIFLKKLLQVFYDEDER